VLAFKRAALRTVRRLKQPLTEATAQAAALSTWTATEAAAEPARHAKPPAAAWLTPPPLPPPPASTVVNGGEPLSAADLRASVASSSRTVAGSAASAGLADTIHALATLQPATDELHVLLQRELASVAQATAQADALLAEIQRSGGSGSSGHGVLASPAHAPSALLRSRAEALQSELRALQDAIHLSPT